MKKLLLFSIVSLFFTSCALTLPVTATSNQVGDKVGMSKAQGYLGFLWFDVIPPFFAAAKNGGITTISTVDIKSTNLLGIIMTYETIVTGN